MYCISCILICNGYWCGLHDVVEQAHNFTWHGNISCCCHWNETSVDIAFMSSGGIDLLFICTPPGVSTSQTQQASTSQVLQPEEALYLRKKKKRPILHDPYTRFSALLYRRPPQEDQKAILASMDNIDLDHATLLWKFLRTRLQPCNTPHSKISSYR